MTFQLGQRQQELIERIDILAREQLGGHGLVPATGSLPTTLVRTLADAGLAGITIAPDDGGKGGALLDAIVVIEAMAQRSVAAADALQALNFGAVQQLARYGSAELKRQYLRRCLEGEQVISIAMTEPEAGSAITDLQCTARCQRGTVVIDGEKTFVTNGDIADCFLVWAKFGERASNTGAVVVERRSPGLTVNSVAGFMSGERYSRLQFEECRVPTANVLVPDHGFSRMLPVFNVERLGNAARALAYGQAAFDLAVDHVRSRHQFGRRLVEFQGLQWRFADMKLALESARLLLYRAAASADAGGVPSALDSSLAKLACNRAGFQTADAALQMLGAYGYEDGAELNYLFRRTRGWMIAGGTVEQMLNRIASEVFDEPFSNAPRAAHERSRSLRALHR